MQKHEAYAQCKAHINKFVRIQMQDGAVYDGIIEKVDQDHVYVACPVAEGEQSRYYPYPAYGPGFGPGYGPGYGYNRFRRFALPLFGLTALTLLPFGYF